MRIIEIGRNVGRRLLYLTGYRLIKIVRAAVSEWHSREQRDFAAFESVPKFTIQLDMMRLRLECSRARFAFAIPIAVRSERRVHTFCVALVNRSVYIEANLHEFGCVVSFARCVIM